MIEIVPASAFNGFVTLLILALAGGWGIVDTIRLGRALREDRSSPEVRDRIFGCMIGLVIAGLGMGSVAYFHFT